MELDRMLALARLALAFGRVNRVTYHEDGVTPESDSDHAVMLGLIACEVANANGINANAVAGYALVHDLVEAYCGDTNSFAMTEEERWEKEDREAAAIELLREEHRGSPWLLMTINDYERGACEAARLVRFIDKVMPGLTHALNGCATFKSTGRTKDDIVRAHREQRALLWAKYPELVDIVGPMFDAAGKAAEEAW